MSENQNPHGIRTPGGPPARKPIPDGALSSGGVHRNALGAAGDDDPDAPDSPEVVTEMIDAKHKATGRDPNRPGVL